MSKASSKVSSGDPTPVDPTEPAVPVSYPIKTIEELKSRSYFESFHYPFNKASVALQYGTTSSSLPNRRRLLACHDMAGGYIDDKWVQGGTNGEAFAIWHWYLIDVFVYFAHYLVTLPPPSWTNAAHQHGVKVLGTFIPGQEESNKLLSTKESSQTCAERLTELAVALGFDGWLLNMEVKVQLSQIPNLKEFVSHLTQTMHSSIPGSLVIWYDSVTINGNIAYQNQLNEQNKPFFDICDGIFANYWWTEEGARASAAAAGDRNYDVYMGNDIFGRGTFGGGGWNTYYALDVLNKADVSAALFAPGWVYETNQPPDFPTANNHWWSLVEKSWGIAQNYPKVLPFYSNFDQGRGLHFSVDGEQVLDTSWNNISCQGFQPFLEYSDSSSENAIQVLVDLKESSYSGGSNITFKGKLEDSASFTTRLFLGELPLGDSTLYIQYSVKSENNSLLGLELELSSNTTGEKKSVLVAPWGVDHLSGKFSEVVITQLLEELGNSLGWVINKGSVALSGFKLTEISAVCRGPEEYYAVLGHIVIKTSEQGSSFPPSSSWLVEGQYIKWTPGSEGSKTSVSVKITWNLKDGNNDSEFPSYNIYVEKIAEKNVNKPHGMLEAEREFLGVARVKAFYVADFEVPSGISSVKFFIQVCGLDGSTQKLDDSPFLQLDAP